MTGCPVAWKCFVACLLGESSQQPTWPQLRQIRRCSHSLPLLRHSSQPSALGVTLRMPAMWVQPFAIQFPVLSSLRGAQRRSRYGRSLLSAPRTEPYVRLSRVRLPPPVFDGEHAVCVPAPVTRLPGTEPGTCYADPHSPRSPPLAPPTPQQIALPCSPASQLLRRGLTSHARSSSATAPHPPHAGPGGRAVRRPDP